ncbi:MAG: hypothetical protein WC511_03900 [Candidatus Pacearchaeota archaeon]
MNLDNYVPWIVCGTIGTVASVGTIAWAKNYYNKCKEESKELAEAWKDMVRHIKIDNNPELLSTVGELCQLGGGEYRK